MNAKQQYKEAYRTMRNSALRYTQQVWVNNYRNLDTPVQNAIFSWKLKWETNYINFPRRGWVLDKETLLYVKVQS